MNLNKYVNLPYKNLGRDFDGVDCYGLCVLIYKDYLNIDIPDYANLSYSQDWYKKEENHVLSNINWLDKVEQPYKRFDGLLLYNGTKVVVNHIGLYMEDNKFIHISEGGRSKVDRFRGYWESKLYSGVRFINV